MKINSILMETNVEDLKMKKCVVLGAGGFIGGHLVKKLKKEGYWVRGVDIKKHEYSNLPCDEFLQGDLRDIQFCSLALSVPSIGKETVEGIDEVYQLAADMGGAGFVFTGENDFDIMHNSAVINLNVAEIARRFKKFNEKQLEIKKIFYSSSACVYPERNQLDPNNPVCSEDSAYPAAPDSEYGWEKLFSERMWFSFEKETGIPVRVARFHNIFGPYGTWDGGREKAPAAMCRKVVESKDGSIEVWGPGTQTRSFLYIDECVEGVLKCMESDVHGPLNIGSEEMVTINQLLDMAAEIAKKKITKNHIEGPLGVAGRNSDNKLIKEKLNWKPTMKLYDGLKITYDWVDEQVKNKGE
jgi:nucleoside-diphosphate-sugar epimerase